LSNLTNLINQIPQMPRRQVVQPTQQDVTSKSIEQVLGFIARELPIKKDLANSQALHLKLTQMVNALEALIDKTDVNKFAEDLRDSLAEMNEKLESPIVNVDFPREELKALLTAVKAIKLEQSETVAVTNLSEVTKALNELKPLLMALDKDEVEGPEDVVLDAESKKLLKNLTYLDTDAKNPLAVRLSDGREFYKGIGQLNDGIRAMTGSSGNNFLTPTGSPTKANLDADGKLIVTSSPSSVSAAVTSVAGAVSSTTLLAANTSRKGFIIYNDSTAILYVKLGSSASTSSFTYRLTPNGIVTESAFGYTGIITGIWTSATGNVRITELS